MPFSSSSFVCGVSATLAKSKERDGTDFSSALPCQSCMFFPRRQRQNCFLPATLCFCWRWRSRRWCCDDGRWDWRQVGQPGGHDAVHYPDWTRLKPARRIIMNYLFHRVCISYCYSAFLLHQLTKTSLNQACYRLVFLVIVPRGKEASSTHEVVPTWFVRPRCMPGYRITMSTGGCAKRFTQWYFLATATYEVQQMCLSVLWHWCVKNQWCLNGNTSGRRQLPHSFRTVIQKSKLGILLQVNTSRRLTTYSLYVIRCYCGGRVFHLIPIVLGYWSLYAVIEGENQLKPGVVVCAGNGVNIVVS